MSNIIYEFDTFKGHPESRLIPIPIPLREVFVRLALSMKFDVPDVVFVCWPPNRKHYHAHFPTSHQQVPGLSLTRSYEMVFIYSGRDKGFHSDLTQSEFLLTRIGGGGEIFGIKRG